MLYCQIHCNRNTETTLVNFMSKMLNFAKNDSKRQKIDDKTKL